MPLPGGVLEEEILQLCAELSPEELAELRDHLREKAGDGDDHPQQLSLFAEQLRLQEVAG